MKSIALTHGLFALVDDCDYEAVMAHKWSAIKAYKAWYAMTSFGNERLYMHRLIMAPKLGEKVDHRDRNGLNNCRDNLRIATMSQNQGNRGLCHNNKFGFKGVRKHHNPNCQRWLAQMTSNGKSIYIGIFDSPQEAAIAYDAAALEKWGDFALTNRKLGLV